MSRPHVFAPGTLVTAKKQLTKPVLFGSPGTDKKVLGLDISVREIEYGTVAIVIATHGGLIGRNRDQKTFIMTSTGELGWVWGNCYVEV